MRVAIVGGGIAGLALAAGLDPAHHDVTVYERQPGRHGIGTALGMWPAAQQALRSLGAAGVLATASTVQGGALHSVTGRVIARPPGTQALSLVSRSGLWAALDAAVPDSVERIALQVDDPGDLTADLVVGADGVHSRVRRSIWGSSTASAVSSMLAVRGIVTPSGSDVYGEFWGRGRLFGITPVPGAATNWFCAFGSDLGPHRVALPAAVTAARLRFATDASAINDVLDRLDTQQTIAHRIWIAPALRSYHRGRTVLIGDAAHGMAPNLGRGACESLVDASVLARLLNTGGNLGALLRGYDRARVLPSQLARLGSSLMSRVATRRFLNAA